MKKVKINNGEIGIVYKSGNFKTVLKSGSYWITWNEKVYIYNIYKPFTSFGNLTVLLEEEELLNELEIITVLDNEIYLKFEDNLFKEVLTAGKYAFWKDNNKVSFTKVDLNNMQIDENINKAILIHPNMYAYIRVYIVESYEKGVLYIDGKKSEILESGTYHFWKNNSTIRLEKIDLRQIQLEISGQEILTKDKAALRINFYTQYVVNNVEKALIENKNFEKQLYILIQLALREFIGQYTLDELLENKTSVSTQVIESMKIKAKNLGVDIIDAGIKDIILNGEMKEIMNQVLIAQKKAQANVISRREETAATRSLLNTAKLMEENNMLFQLKEMEYMEKIAHKIGEISIAGNGNVIKQLKNIISK